MKALLALQAYVNASELEPDLLEPVKYRASQINGCAWCMDMHACAAGETEQRIYLLSAWRECPFYSARDRAALAWTEAVTLLADGSVSDEVFAEKRHQRLEPDQHRFPGRAWNLSTTPHQNHQWRRCQR